MSRELFVKPIIPIQTWEQIKKAGVNTDSGFLINQRIIKGSVEDAKSVSAKELKVAYISKSVGTKETIQDAIDTVHKAGGGEVIIENGTHYPHSDITLYSNIYLRGQNGDSAIIDFGSKPYGIKVEGKENYSAGTISITNSTLTLTGSSTVWTADMVGRNVLLAGIWYPIAAFVSATELTLAIPYADSDLSGATYMLATTIDDNKITDITIKNSTVAGIKFLYASESMVVLVKVVNCAIGIDLDYVSNITIDNLDAIYCTVGLDFDNVHYSVIKETGTVVILSDAIDLNTCTNMVLNSNFFLTAVADGLKMTSCETFLIIGNVFKKCGGQGIELVSGNNGIQIISTRVSDSTSDGIKLTATSDKCIISNCQLFDNGGYGINIAADTCDNNIIGTNHYSGNSSGNINDSGTGTDNLDISNQVGDALLVVADVEESEGANTTYKKQKDIEVNRYGTLRIKFDLKVGAASAGRIAYGKIYKNGVAVGTERITTLDTYTTYSEDISGIVPGDNIQLYTKGAGTETIWWKNFRIYVYQTDTTTVVDD